MRQDTRCVSQTGLGSSWRGMGQDLLVATCSQVWLMVFEAQNLDFSYPWSPDSPGARASSQPWGARAGGRPQDPVSAPSEPALVRRPSPAAGYWRPLLVRGLRPGSSGNAASIFCALVRRGRLTEGRLVAPSASRDLSGTSFCRFRFSLKLSLRCAGPGEHPVLLRLAHFVGTPNSSPKQPHQNITAAQET